MDEERSLLIALVDARRDISNAMAEHGPDSRESFMASAAFEWEMQRATQYLDSIKVKRGGARPMPRSTIN